MTDISYQANKQWRANPPSEWHSALVISNSPGLFDSNIVHRGIRETLPEGVPLGIHRREIHPLDCFRDNAWGLGNHVWVGDHHVHLCASTWERHIGVSYMTCRKKYGRIT